MLAPCLQGVCTTYLSYTLCLLDPDHMSALALANLGHRQESHVLGGQIYVDVGTRAGLGAMLRHNAELGPQLVQRQRSAAAQFCWAMQGGADSTGALQHNSTQQYWCL